jgi:hypothetical protein
MSTKSTAPAACLVIEGNAVTSDQQIGTDMSLVTSKILQWSDVSKPTFMSLLHRSKKEVLDTADPQQVPTPGVDRNALANDVVDRVPLSLWLKRDQVKTK